MRAVLLLMLCYVTLGRASDEITELKIETITKPESCERAAARGDLLTMHYKGSLLDGKVFDSR